MSKKKRQKEIDGKNEIPAKSADKSPRVHQRDKINFSLSIRERDDFTERQKELIGLILDKKSRIIFISGPSGTAKTYLSVYCALHLLNSHRVSDILFVRSIAESSEKSLGALPGEIVSKIEPFMVPLQEKLEELLSKGDVTFLKNDSRIHGVVVNHLRGASYNAKCLIAEESQNFTRRELTTILTRLGEFSKFIIIGDPMQSDINGKSGFMSMFDLFNDESSKERGIHCFSLTNKDIVRSGLLGYIVERIENMPKTM